MSPSLASYSVTVMQDLNIRHLATDDADMSHIPGITVWTPA